MNRESLVRITGIPKKGIEILSIVVYGIVPDVSFAAIVMPPVPLPSGSLRR